MNNHFVQIFIGVIITILALQNKIPSRNVIKKFIFKKDKKWYYSKPTKIFSKKVKKKYDKIILLKVKL